MPKETAELVDCLHLLYEETADYIRVNNLGDIHHNRTMRYARDVLAKHGRALPLDPPAEEPYPDNVPGCTCPAPCKGTRHGPRELSPIEDQVCRTCEGKGYSLEEYNQHKTCPDCHGTGRLKAPEFCLSCGAGVGKHRRVGEGTCPKCDPVLRKRLDKRQ